MDKVKAQPQSHSMGDTAVSGLIGGLLGGLAMALVILLFSLLAGQGAAYLGYFSSTTPVPPLQGLLMHLAVSSIYGMLYSLVLRWIRAERLKLAAAFWERALAEWARSVPAEVDTTEVAKVQKKLDTAKVRLAKQNERKAEAVKP